MQANICNDNIPQFDLPVYIQEHYPGTLVGGYSPHKRSYAVLCAWRGEKRASGSLTYRDGVWLWYDHGTRQGGNAVDFLIQVGGYSKKEAIELVYGKRLAKRNPPGKRGEPGDKHMITQTTPLGELKPSTMAVLEKSLEELLEKGLPKSWAGRGLNLDDAVAYGLGRIGDDTLIPICDSGGKVVHVKRRIHEPAENQSRYVYLESGRGSPCWYSPNWYNPGNRAVVVVEGEGKAMSADNALSYHRKVNDDAAYYALLGVPGASASIPVEEIKKLGKPVFIIPDLDESGKRAVFGTREKPGWEGLLREAGVETYVLPAMADLCDIANGYTQTYGHIEGNAMFGAALVRLFQSALQGKSVRLMTNRINQHGSITPKMLRGFGLRAHYMCLFVQGILREISRGQFILGKYLEDADSIPKEYRQMPAVRLSQTEAAELIGSKYRRQGERIRQYAVEAGILIPIDKALYPLVITKKGVKDTNVYIVNLSVLFNYSSTIENLTDDKSQNGFYAVRDAARVNSRIANPLGVRGQLVYQYLRRVKRVTVSELTAYLGCHGNTTRRLLSRLQAWGLVKVLDKIVELLEGASQKLTEYLELARATLKKSIAELWQSVVCPFERVWRPRSTRTRGAAKLRVLASRPGVV